MDDLTRRAFAAYFRSIRANGEIEVQPSEGRSGVAKVADLEYVVLRNNYEVLAVYRVQNTGTLKRLRRWPAELEK